MTVSADIVSLEAAAQAVVARTPFATAASIREDIEKLRNAFQVTDDEAERLARDLEARHQIHIGESHVLKTDDFRPWLPAAKAKIDPYYWDRYRQLLVDQGLAGSVIGALDGVTDRILGLMQNPALEGEWDRRGLVVGHVQSGKTANYTGLVAKSADAGYRLIIVIAGIHNSLRNQTQIRIDQGFIGRDSSDIRKNSSREPVGVGRFDSTRRPQSFTTSIRDFNSRTADSVGVQIDALKEPAVLVIKKNSTTLKNLIDWLVAHNAKRGTSKIEAPLLLIDDEADNASINIQHGKGAVARINGQIRQLLNLFERKCYIGYTATPFANIFIDPETDDEMFQQDLFPRDFIVSLDPPSNYVGPTSVFLDSPEQFIRHISDNEDLLPVVHKIHHQVAGLPESLREAIRTFILNRAVRLSRGDRNSHNSMLVNVSRFTSVQSQVWSHIHEYLGEIRDAVRAHGGRRPVAAQRDPDISDLAATWSRSFRDKEVSWETIFPLLLDAVAPIEVMQINSQSASALDYHSHAHSGLNVIAVGGFSLSRGLTLEGLSVSYFLRNSQAYDTLLQMGRWFGYRPRYEDLCKIWMPENAESWYAHLAESVEELRSEFRLMEQSGAAPRDFGLRVRSHPDSLIVTARNRIGTGERVVVRVGLQNDYVETAALLRSLSSQENNLNATTRFFSELDGLGFPLPEVSQTEGYLIMGAPVDPILRFLEAYENDPVSLLTETDPIRQYIWQRRSDELSKWDVLLASTGTNNQPMTLFGRHIALPMRTVGVKTDEKTIRVTNKQRVASRGIERVGLDDEIVAKVEADWDADPESRKGQYPDRIYREMRGRPLLVIFPLDLRWPTGQWSGPESASAKAGARLNSKQPIIAWGMSFPRTSKPEKQVEYIVNNVWLDEYVRGYNDIDDDPELEAAGA